MNIDKGTMWLIGCKQVRHDIASDADNKYNEVAYNETENIMAVKYGNSQLVKTADDNEVLCKYTYLTKRTVKEKDRLDGRIVVSVTERYNILGEFEFYECNVT